MDIYGVNLVEKTPDLSFLHVHAASETCEKARIERRRRRAERVNYI